MKTVAEAGGLVLKTRCSDNPLCGNTPWFADVETDDCAPATVGSAARCRTEREAVDDALSDAERNLEALADKAREAMAE